MEKNEENGKKKISNSFLTGTISLIFLIIGYQTALFVQKAAVAHIVANKDKPDTVFILCNPSLGKSEPSQLDTNSGRGGECVRSVEKTRTQVYRKNSKHSEVAQNIRDNYSPREYKSFRFNPNTATVADFQRLGFSEKQAQSIVNYRNKDGKFRRKSDFAKSFVVADSVYARLEPFIDIPKIDINKADSVVLVSLPGVGGYFARKIIEYRQALNGFSYPEQLMEIYHFSQEKYDGLKDLITLSNSPAYPLWELSLDSLALHPYISKQVAKSIMFYKQHNDKELWTLEKIYKASIIDSQTYQKLKKCNIKNAI